MTIPPDMVADMLQGVARGQRTEVRQLAEGAALLATDSKVQAVAPSTPTTPLTSAGWMQQALLIGLLLASGYGVGWAEEILKWQATVLPLVAMLIVAAVAAGWGFVQKQVDDYRRHQIALASAAASAAATAKASELAGRPIEVQVPLQPSKS